MMYNKITMSKGINWDERGGFDFNRFLRRYLSPDDLYDMDEGLAQHATSGVGAAGAIIVPPGESVQRTRDPLSEETERNFGKYALEALARTDIYLDPED